MVSGRHDCGATLSDAQAWDAFVAANPHGYHEQTAMYGKIRRAYGFACERVVVRQGQEIVGGAQVIVQQTPIGRFARVFAGPLAAEDDPAIMARVIDQLDHLCNAKSYACMRIDTLPSQGVARHFLKAEGFQASDEWFGARPSLIMKLSCSEEHLFSGLNKKSRQYIRAAERAGAYVKDGTVDFLSEFYTLYRMTAAHQGFRYFRKDYFSALTHLFGGVGRLRIFVAYSAQGEPIAARLAIIVGDRCHDAWCGMHRGSVNIKLRANILIHHHVMKWARAQGCKHYDLVGIQTNKKRIAKEIIYWPSPMRKFYGRFGTLRRKTMAWAWANVQARQAVNKAAWRLGLKPRMPW